jgi:hypothetical protein
VSFIHAKYDQISCTRVAPHARTVRPGRIRRGGRLVAVPARFDRARRSGAHPQEQRTGARDSRSRLINDGGARSIADAVGHQLAHRRPHAPPMAGSFLEFDLATEFNRLRGEPTWNTKDGHAHSRHGGAGRERLSVDNCLAGQSGGAHRCRVRTRSSATIRCLTGPMKTMKSSPKARSCLRGGFGLVPNRSERSTWLTA